MPDDTIEISGLSLAISPEAIQALLRPGGEPGRIEVRLAGLQVRLPQAALNAVLHALAPPGDGETGAGRLDLTAGRLAANLSLGDRTLAVSVPLQRLALAVEEAGLRVSGE